jgi:hypothetical protein
MQSSSQVFESRSVSTTAARSQSLNLELLQRIFKHFPPPILLVIEVYSGRITGHRPLTVQKRPCEKQKILSRSPAARKRAHMCSRNSRSFANLRGACHSFARSRSGPAGSQSYDLGVNLKMLQSPLNQCLGSVGAMLFEIHSYWDPLSLARKRPTIRRKNGR